MAYPVAFSKKPHGSPIAQVDVSEIPRMGKSLCRRDLMIGHPFMNDLDTSRGITRCPALGGMGAMLAHEWPTESSPHTPRWHPPCPLNTNQTHESSIDDC
jgi:hypothetical protein